MLNITIISHGYEKEKEYLKNNISRITDRNASFKPKHKSVLQVIMRDGQIREYHGALAIQVFGYLTRLGESN